MPKDQDRKDTEMVTEAEEQLIHDDESDLRLSVTAAAVNKKWIRENSDFKMGLKPVPHLDGFRLITVRVQQSLVC